jgi:NTE family protein
MKRRPRIGLALGSGSARGWSHIGVIRELESLGVVPDVIAGSSIGALVGGAYAAGKLDPLEEWLHTLTWRKVMSFMDVSLGGGCSGLTRSMATGCWTAGWSTPFPCRCVACSGPTW